MRRAYGQVIQRGQRPDRRPPCRRTRGPRIPGVAQVPGATRAAGTGRCRRSCARRSCRPCCGSGARRPDRGPRRGRPSRPRPLTTVATVSALRFSTLSPLGRCTRTSLPSSTGVRSSGSFIASGAWPRVGRQPRPPSAPAWPPCDARWPSRSARAPARGGPSARRSSPHGSRQHAA
jgi:hypothetical protein